MNAEGFTSILYDKIMDNAGMSEHHIKLDHTRISAATLYCENGKIEIEYVGKKFLILVEEI